MITPLNSRTEASLSATIIVKSLHLHLTGAPKLTHKYSSLPDLKCRNNCNIHTYTSDDDLTTAVGDKNSPRTGCLDYNLTLKGKDRCRGGVDQITKHGSDSHEPCSKAMTVTHTSRDIDIVVHSRQILERSIYHISLGCLGNILTNWPEK